jgi:hypothetical protein
LDLALIAISFYTADIANGHGVALVDKNTELARLYDCFNRLSAEQKKEVIKTAESLLEQQEEKAELPGEESEP